MGFLEKINFKKIKEGLQTTHNKIIGRISEVITGKAIIDDSTIEELEEILISSDIGYALTSKIIDKIRSELKNDKNRTIDNIKEILRQELMAIFPKEHNAEYFLDKVKSKKPYVFLIVGINGAGKTTTVGKLAKILKDENLKVIIGSADTFRAAANEQLDIWAKRAGVQIVSGASKDPSSVVFDTISKAISNDYDVVLIDTAGRLHTKNDLMFELQKIFKVSQKLLPDAPHEVFLVLDGNTGQNAIVQATEFEKFTKLTGLVITKLDGTAKGGVLFKIVLDKNLPIRFIGVGEGIDDLQYFDPKTIIDAIVN